MKIERVCGHSFSRDLLSISAVVFDCGANHGEFSKWISNNCSAVVHAFEPDPRLFPKLPSLSNVSFYPQAVSGTGEPLTLRLGEARCSSAYLSESAAQESIVVPSVKLDAFYNEKELSRVDLIKLDIEGAEIGVITEWSGDFLENIGQITVEFHDFIRKEEAPIIRRVISKLRNAGFLCIKFSHNDYSDVLCINTKIHPVSLRQIFHLYRVKYLRGFLRLFRRRFGLSKPGGPQ